jgi:integrase
MKLLQKTVPSLTLPAGKSEHIFFDDDLPGFGIRIRTGGSRNWVFQYKLGTKQRRVTLGSSKALNASKARDKAGEMYAQVRLGHDPAGQKIEARNRAVETFEAAQKQFLASQKERLKLPHDYKGRLKPRTYQEIERHLLTHAKPLHNLQLGKISRRTIAVRLTEVATTSGPTAANRVRATLSAFFGWAVREGLVEANPVIGTNRSHENGARNRVLSNDELREIWGASAADDHYSGVVRLLMLTGQRREEIGGLRWREIDLESQQISLPADRTKNHRPHDIPLSELALEVLKRQGRREGRDLVFGEGQGGFQGWSNAKEALSRRILQARQDVAEKAGSVPQAVKPMTPWRLHDLRRTMATRMHEELSLAPHIVEAVLNHVSGHKAGVAGTYNWATYERAKRTALVRWAEYVRTIVGGGVP